MPLIHDAERIAVLRSNGIGDFVFALPALAALRVAYPQARITLLGRSWHSELLEGRPGPVDDVITVPPWQGVRDEALEDPDQVEEFFAAMRGRRFDLALQLHGGGGNSNPFVKRLGATVTAGMRAPGAERLDLELPYVYYQPEVTRLLEVVSLVGAGPSELEPRLVVTDRDRQGARAFLEAASSGSDDGELVALNPGAGDTRRRWPTGKFAEVGDVLAEAGYRVVLTGSASDVPLAEEIADAMHVRPLIAAGRLRLDGLLGLFESCRVVISNDSGPLHLAGATGAPTVGIFWCGNLINAGPLFRTRQRPLLSWRLECPVCGLDCTRGECEHGDSFVAEIPVSEVAEAAFDLLSSDTASRDGQASPPSVLGSGEWRMAGRGGHDD